MGWRQTIYKAALKNLAVLLCSRVRILPTPPSQKTFPLLLLRAFQLLQMWAVNTPSAKPINCVEITIAMISAVVT
jgi:hypothetical protein